jgi:ubiquinone/menaquinone biosynthesis C-methylase UbiE
MFLSNFINKDLKIKNRMSDNHEMRAEWNSIAKINAHYGVDSIEDFEKSEIDEDLFYKRGAETAEKFLNDIDLPDSSELVMVEIGCGLGRMSHYFADVFKKVYSFDVSDEMINRASKKFSDKKNLEFVLGSGSDLQPLNSGSIDFVFSFIVLQHALNAGIVLKYIHETGRVLKIGGQAFLQFRTFTPVTEGDPFNLVMLIPRPVRKFVKKFLPAKKVKEVANLTYDNLEDKYTNEFKVWHGCAVSIPEAMKAFNEANLRIVRVSGENTQYTFYTLTKY